MSTPREVLEGQSTELLTRNLSIYRACSKRMPAPPPVVRADGTISKQRAGKPVHFAHEALFRKHFVIDMILIRSILKARATA